jgi:hypothetical protein
VQAQELYQLSGVSINRQTKILKASAKNYQPFCANWQEIRRKVGLNSFIDAAFALLRGSAH